MTEVHTIEITNSESDRSRYRARVATKNAHEGNEP